MPAMRVLRSATCLAACTAVTVLLNTAATWGARADLVAKLQGKDGRKVAGSATAVPSADGMATLVTVSIEGDTPGATRPWHVHTGSCAKSGGVVGGARPYTPMVIDAQGRGSAKATVPVLLADTATYYVNVHDAAAAMGVIVACGDLQQR